MSSANFKYGENGYDKDGYGIDGLDRDRKPRMGDVKHTLTPNPTSEVRVPLHIWNEMMNLLKISTALVELLDQENRAKSPSEVITPQLYQSARDLIREANRFSTMAWTDTQSTH